MSRRGPSEVEAFRELICRLGLLRREFDQLSGRCVKAKREKTKKLVVACDWTAHYLSEIHEQLLKEVRENG